MGFALKKFIAAFLMPIPLSLLLLLSAFFFLYKKHYLKAKYIFITAFMILLLSSNAVFANFYISFLENKYPKYEKNKDVEYILVLGSAYNDSSKVPLSSKLSSAGIKRVSEGIMLQKADKDRKLILSGYGARGEQSTAAVNAEFAKAFGVEAKEIVLFEDTKDTFEEFETFKKRFGSAELIVVTSAMHMPRAVAIAKKLNLLVIPAPTDFLFSADARVYDFGAKNIQKVESATHEYLGLLWYKMRGYI